MLMSETSRTIFSPFASSNRINASPGNLTPVFDAILEKAMRLCDAAFGMFNTYDGQSFHTVVTRGVPAAFADFRAKHPPIPGPGSPIGRALETKRPVHVFDWLEDPAYKQGDPGGRAIADLGGARTVLNVPLVKDAAVLGMISFYRQQVRPFSDKQIALLENFAAQAVIAIENARLLDEIRQRTIDLQQSLEYQTATSDVLKVISRSTFDLKPVLEALLSIAKHLCDADYAMVSQREANGFRALATQSASGEWAATLEGRLLLEDRSSVTGRAALAKRPVQIADAASDPDYALSGAVAVGQTRTCLGVPLLRDGVVVGVIILTRTRVEPFSDRQIELVSTFADQAVIAIENTRLLTEQREALEQQTATAEVLQVINANPGNLAPVFDTILEKAHILCSTTCGSLELIDRDRIYAVAVRGFSETFADALRNGDLAADQPATGPLLRGEQYNHIIDVSQIDHPTFRVAAKEGLGTVLFTPLCKDGVLLGMIASARREVRPFSEKEIAVLESFAAQAVIAMENSRLLNEVRQRQEELRITFEHMGDGVAMFDETQHLVAWNGKFQEILDVPDDIIARRQTFTEYVRYLAERGEYGPEADPEEQIRRFTENADQYRAFERIRPGGRVIEIRHNPVPGGGFVLIYADITERKRNEAEIAAARDAAEEASRTIEAAYRELKTAQANLIQAEKMASLGQLTAGIAHEIKNPLNFVNNFSALSTELIDELRDVLAPEPLGETARTEVDDLTALLKGNLEKVVQHGQRADGIVRSMLDHSRGSSGERRMVDLNALIDEALNLAYHGARAQDQSFNIMLERDFGEGIAPIEVNPQDITRVFLNIFSNGFYASTRRAREGGDAGFVPTLTVTTRDAGEAVEIRVRDNGTGIPADIRDKLFQPFFTTKPTGEGTGLGLSITYDIVTQQHGGSIAVDSVVGEYTEFAIRLPRKP
jgi:two-component system, NtrC family, sensor kinase